MDRAQIGTRTARMAWVIGCIAVHGGAAHAQCDPDDLFGPPLSFPASAVQPWNAIAADFDRDGHIDVLTESNDGNQNFGTGFVSLVRGLGGGLFAPPVRTEVFMKYPSGLSIGDLNGDGLHDIACGDFGADPWRVAILLGAGDGTFLPPSFVLDGVPTPETSMADMDRDGRTDLLVVEQGADRVWYLRGAGDGTFLSQTPIPVGDQPAFMSIADVDGDGALDIVVTGRIFSSPDEVSIVRGNGSGQFFAQVRIGVGGEEPHRPAIADLNADGINDIVVANRVSNSVSVLVGLGGTSFEPPVTYGVGSVLRHARVGDLDDDGNLDVIVTSDGSGGVNYIRGVGDGTFEAQRFFPTNAGPADGALADANGDGVDDFLVIHGGTQDLTPLINLCSPDGTIITEQPQDTIASAGGGTALSVGAEGPGSITYRWQVDGEDLFDGGNISGAGSPSLVISPVRIGDSGAYRVRVTGPDREILSNTARLGVVASCVSDLDADGDTDSDDFFLFLEEFAAGCP